MRKKFLLVSIFCISLLLAGCNSSGNGENLEENVENSQAGSLESEVLETESIESSTEIIDTELTTENTEIVFDGETNSSEVVENSTEDKVPEEDKTSTEEENDEPTKPNESKPVLENYTLSEKSYDYMGSMQKLCEDRFIVWENNIYNIVDRAGNVYLSFEDYPSWIGGNEMIYYTRTEKVEYVWNFKSNEKIYKYVPVEEISYSDDIVDVYGNSHHIYSTTTFVRREYQGGILAESIFLREEGEDEVWFYRMKFINTETGKVIFEGYTATAGDIQRNYPYEMPDVFSDDNSEGAAVIIEHQIEEGKYYVVAIEKNGYKKYPIEDISKYQNGCYFHNNGYLKNYKAGIMIDLKIGVESQMAKIGEFDYMWFGRAETFGYGYDDICVYKKEQILKEHCTSVDFTSSNYIVCGTANGDYEFLDYDGNLKLTVKGYGGFIDGRFLVNDGNEIYMLDESLNKVSDYIYNGIIEEYGTHIVKVNGKYHFIVKQ